MKTRMLSAVMAAFMLATASVGGITASAAEKATAAEDSAETTAVDEDSLADTTETTADTAESSDTEETSSVSEDNTDDMEKFREVMSDLAEAGTTEVEPDYYGDSYYDTDGNATLIKSERIVYNSEEMQFIAVTTKDGHVFYVLINFSAEKINGIKILNDICGKIKEKLFINYNIMIEKQNININEYNILNEYDQKLDYVISLQNKIINDLKNVNNELKQNINSFKDKNNQNKNEINEKELNDNINNTNENIKNLEIMLENHFNKNAIENLKDINIPDFKENDNFFSIIQSIYTPLKEVNKAFEQILMESSYDEKNY